MRTVTRTPSRAFVLVGTALVLALLGCTGSPAPTASPSEPPVPRPTASGTPAPAVATTVEPDDDATQARAVFDAVNGRTLMENPTAQGADFIAALVTAGFARDTLEVTRDKTSVNLVPGSIQFSARWGEVCLVGQNGEGSGGYRSESTPVLATGKCLIGGTRALDF